MQYSVWLLIVNRSICRNSHFVKLQNEENHFWFMVYWTNSWFAKHLKSIWVNNNIFKYGKFGDSKVLVVGTKSKMTSKYGINFFIDSMWREWEDWGVIPRVAHRQGGCLECWRLQGRISAVAELHRFILCIRRSWGIAHEDGGTTSQLDLPSLTP